MLAGIITVAESMNKLERINFRISSLKDRPRLLLKTLAWLGVCIGGSCAIISPLINMATSRWQDVVLLLGVACLLISNRLKELD